MGRVLQLRELEESLGHEWIWRGGRLRQLAAAGKFAECEQVLSESPPTSAQAAWFIFANADVPDGYLRVGQVQFFSHRLWPEAVTNRGFNARLADAEFPAELDEHALKELTPRDGAEAHVYARVELVGPRAQGTRNPWAHGRPPVAWARELVTSIVEAATFRLGGSRWKLLSGMSVYHGSISDESGTFGNWSGSPIYADPAVFEENRRPLLPLYEGTGEALESLEGRFAELLAEGDSVAGDAVAEVKWYEATRRQTDPAQRVVLHIRAFERALPMTAGEHWNDLVKRYFRETWALDEFNAELFDLAQSSDLILRRHDFSALQSLERWIIDEIPYRFRISLGALFRQAGIIETLVPHEHRLERRALRQVTKWQRDALATRDHLGDLAQRFDILLGRALRQRNAVVHGVKTVAEVVATVDSFVAQLAAYVVAQAVEGGGTDTDLIDVWVPETLVRSSRRAGVRARGLAR